MVNSLSVRATMVPDEFIDRYMPEANGEYVKVYLYLLRHQERTVTVTELADAMNHTESDIRRAMAYWERKGVLVNREESAEDSGGTGGRPAAEGAADKPAAGAAAPDAPRPAEETGRKTAVANEDVGPGSAAARDGERMAKAAGADGGPGSADGTRSPAQRPLYTPEQVKQLAEDEDFSQLLYIAQKYMNKIFTPRECEVFAYLYDGLELPADLLEYLVEYCVREGHSGIRYLETVAIDWHEKGIRTVEAARKYTASFSGEAFAVMKAFGMGDRRPGDVEMEMIHKWFREWGFSRELVLEACGRTLKATQKPSFAYADRILEEWKNAGVRVPEDVRKADQAREGRRSRTAGQTAPARKSGNRFHNFEQRDTNYDAIVMERLKERLGEQQEAPRRAAGSAAKSGGQ